MKPMRISPYQLANGTGVLPRRINEIMHGKRAITANTVLRLGCFFATEPQFWMNLPARYALRMRTQDSGIGALARNLTLARLILTQTQRTLQRWHS